MYDSGSLYSILFLLYSWGSLLGVTSKIPLLQNKEAALRGLAAMLSLHQHPTLLVLSRLYWDNTGQYNRGKMLG